ncbi:MULTISPECIES: hypothetical protein [unclassified Legionella]|uniref:hypothetical protein n=1 Tax=unclassified Legionella TaxID=2622702 RepID=UPI001E4845A0|nr:hypothetical protein [Legionella sp. 31fI33]MCC5015153.1 hypothetical protein [Legionella sp. 31fI33]
MPFNIELAKPSSGISIKIQAVKNTINVYFAGPQVIADTVRDNWIHLQAHFITTMPGYIAEPVRGPDAPHIKKDHTHAKETEVMHSHSEFASEITPERFSAYINNMFAQQQAGSHVSEKYQFFVDKKEVEEIVKKFAIYYSGYKNSSTEELYEEATTLSPEEQSAYNKAVEDEREAREQMEAAERIFSHLLIATVLADRHPLYRRPEPQEGLPTEESEDKLDCIVM